MIGQCRSLIIIYSYQSMTPSLQKPGEKRKNGYTTKERREKEKIPRESVEKSHLRSTLTSTPLTRTWKTPSTIQPLPSLQHIHSLLITAQVRDTALFA